MILHALQDLMWSVAGFALGYLIAYFRLTRPEGKPRMFTTNSKQKTEIFGAALIILALFTVGQGYYLSGRSSEVTTCQAKYNEDFAKVLIERSKWADEDRAELSNLIQTLLSSPTREQSRNALQDYVATVKKNDSRRAANPLPDLHSRDCSNPR